MHRYTSCLSWPLDSNPARQSTHTPAKPRCPQNHNPNLRQKTQQSLSGKPASTETTPWSSSSTEATPRSAALPPPAEDTANCAGKASSGWALEADACFEEPATKGEDTANCAGKASSGWALEADAGFAEPAALQNRPRKEKLPRHQLQKSKFEQQAERGDTKEQGTQALTVLAGGRSRSPLVKDKLVDSETAPDTTHPGRTQTMQRNACEIQYWFKSAEWASLCFSCV